MNRILLACIALLTFTSVAGQKTINDPNVEVRTVNGSFSAIDVSDGIDLYLSAGDEAVAISARDADHKSRIRTEVKDGVLRIWYERKENLKNWISDRGLKAYVSYKTLSRLQASGGSDVRLDGTLKATDLKLELSGGSDFNGKVDVRNLVVEQSGGSDVDISGTAAVLKVDASGGSDLEGYDLSVDICEVDASGGSDVTITANQEFSGEATGGSDIRWKGSAKVKRSHASGAGSISHRSR